MGFYISDPEILEILTRYAREVHDEKIRSKWNLCEYDLDGFEFRMTLLKAIG